MNTEFHPRSYRPADNLLADRIILVTGASDGIGKALAVRAAACGARVILHGRNQKKLEAVHDEIDAIEGAARPSIAVMDLLSADSGSYASLADSIAEDFGRLDGLVHNASILGKRHAIEQYDPGEWQQVLHVNLTAPFVLTQAVLPLMRNAEDASVIFTTSGVGNQGKAFWGAYSVSKFGTEGLAQILASEHAHTSIRFNLVNPGPVRTNMRLEAYPAEDRDKLATPQDILPTYLYLLGPDARGVSGQRLDCQ